MIEPRMYAQYANAHLPRLGRMVDDPEALGQALELLEQLRTEVAWAARQLHDRDGFSWAEIAAGCGRKREHTFRSYSAAPETESARKRRERNGQEFAPTSVGDPEVA